VVAAAASTAGNGEQYGDDEEYANVNHRGRSIKARPVPHATQDISSTSLFSAVPDVPSGGCPPNFFCSPTAAVPHHCDRRACANDGDCDCGACIGNVCRDRLNVCSLLAP
jgi:hypothetical protein